MIHIVNMLDDRFKLKPLGEKYSEEYPNVTVVNVMFGTPLGNSYAVGANCTRESSIKKFKSHLWIQIQDKVALPGKPNVMVDELDRLLWIHLEEGELVLECCCSPKPCHAEVVRDAILYLESIGRDWLNYLAFKPSGKS